MRWWAFVRCELTDLRADGWQLLFPLLYLVLLSVFLQLAAVDMPFTQLYSLFLLVIFIGCLSQSLSIFAEELSSGMLAQFAVNQELLLFINARVWLWCVGTFVPILAVAGVLYFLGALGGVLWLNLALAAPAIAWCAAFGGALGASLNRAYLITFIISMPLLLPLFLLILASPNYAAASYFILSFSLFLSALMPLACAAILKQIIAK